MPKDAAAKTATLYRMVMTDHMCPHGLKSKDLLERQGFHVEDRYLTSRDEVDAFKAKHDVKTTPQTFIGEERIGGFDDLSVHLGKSTKSKDSTTYKPIARYHIHGTDSGMVHLDIHGAIGFAKAARR